MSSFLDKKLFLVSCLCFAPFLTFSILMSCRKGRCTEKAMEPSLFLLCGIQKLYSHNRATIRAGKPSSIQVETGFSLDQGAFSQLRLANIIQAPRLMSTFENSALLSKTLPNLSSSDIWCVRWKGYILELLSFLSVSKSSHRMNTLNSSNTCVVLRVNRF